MKKVIIIFFFFILENLYSQTVGIDDFKKFIDDFPERSLPFTTSFDYERASKFSTPLKPIQQTYCEYYLFKYGISDKPDYCPKEKLDNLVYFAKYNVSVKYYLLHFSYFLDAGCGGKDYLVTYTLDGKFCDTLQIYGEGRWMQPTKTNPKSQTYAQEGTVYKDSITTKYVQHNGDIIRDVKGRKIYNKNTYSTYIIDKNGKFKKIREKKEEGYEYFTN